MSSELSRRTVLGLLAASGLGALVGCTDGGSSDAALGCERVTAAFAPSESLIAFGRRYRELYPDDDPDRVGEGVDEGTGDEALRELLAGRVRDDYSAGEVVDVDGWRVSRTEGRITALLVGC